MTTDLAALKATFKGDIVVPTDAKYDQAITRWAKNTAKKAAVVAFVKDAEDVSLAIQYAKAANLTIAIKCGGHNVSGASSIEGGLVIDLSRYLNGVTVDAEKKLGYVGGGALWETVDRATIAQGLATVAGTVNDTGVGGLTLGGGYGWLSGAYGLVLDNLATVVTADGSILTANEKENADLFWGIRGAGSNFGVVTELVLQLHPQRRTVFCGIAFYSPDQLEALLDVTQAWWTQRTSPKEGIFQAFTRGPDHQPTILMVFFYNGSEAEGRQNFKAFFDLSQGSPEPLSSTQLKLTKRLFFLDPVVDLTKEQPYEALNTLLNEANVPGQNAYMKGCFAPLEFPRELLPKVFARTMELSAPTQHKFTLLFEYFRLDKANSVPDDATALRRHLTPNVLCLIRFQEDSEAAAKYCRDAAYELLGLVTGQSADNLGYGNYNPESGEIAIAGSGSVSKAKEHFGANYKRLQEIKKKYDPKLLFRKWFVITPA
ncbi:FAD-binding domain-containing protein [Dichomitus squalens]|uniref:FAD-binding domain-containing protein n=1 Tax=Dichomitus squalens TaxID=114155 RepID=A0A4Q9MXE0_9APHY|nr:FAD-binding domain-containing protein [Dichomitus squalens]